jgi:hypothetical protein
MSDLQDKTPPVSRAHLRVIQGKRQGQQTCVWLITQRLPRAAERPFVAGA